MNNERIHRGVVGRGFCKGSQGSRGCIISRVFRRGDIGWAKAASGDFALPPSQGLLCCGFRDGIDAVEGSGGFLPSCGCLGDIEGGCLNPAKCAIGNGTFDCSFRFRLVKLVSIAVGFRCCVFGSHQGNCCLIGGYLSGMICLSAESVSSLARAAAASSSPAARAAGMT